jgi:hypothetical protein
MPIQHRFLKYPGEDGNNIFNWENGFETHSAILDTIPYEPEVIFIGTFNPEWAWNQADFFYGRGMYMWPVLANLFLHNQNMIANPRTLINNNPTLPQIFEICKRAKITFADIVRETRDNIRTQEFNAEVLVNNEFVWNSYKDKQLDYMGKKGWLEDNVEAIVTYINRTPSIKHVYFTFKTGKWIVRKKNEIINRLTVEDIGSIISPSGNGLGLPIVGYPNPPATMAHTWIWNRLPHHQSVNRPGYVTLSHEWLQSKGVNPNQF